MRLARCGRGRWGLAVAASWGRRADSHHACAAPQLLLLQLYVLHEWTATAVCVDKRTGSGSYCKSGGGVCGV